MAKSTIFPKFISNPREIGEALGLGPQEIEEFERVAKKFPVRVNSHYLSLIDPDNPDDPIRRIVIPHEGELMDDDGDWDPSNENKYTPIDDFNALKQKYEDTVLVIVTDQCGSICRFCFRKRLFSEEGEKDAQKDLDPAFEYIRGHPEIQNVLLTGGDSLMISTRRLEHILSELSDIDHIDTIRLGTKMLAFYPQRVTNDGSLVSLLAEHSTPQKKIYVMAHFTHPNEFSDETFHAIDLLKGTAGVEIRNQTPLLKGVNDDPKVLSKHLRNLYTSGVTPYYLFICRPTIGNKDFSIPIETALDLFNETMGELPGIAKTVKLVMSHYTGKIEVVGMTDDKQIVMKYHRAPNPKDVGKLLTFQSNPQALWLDDYKASTIRV